VGREDEVKGEPSRKRWFFATVYGRHLDWGCGNMVKRGCHGSKLLFWKNVGKSRVLGV